MPIGEKATEKLAVDAQVLIRSLLPSRTRDLLKELRESVILVTTPGKIAELTEWLPSIARKKGLDVDLLMEGIKTLPVEVIPELQFKNKLEMAYEEIGKRDPDDVDLLALALANNIPVWSDDRDFQDSSAQIFTTEDIIHFVEKQI